MTDRLTGEFDVDLVVTVRVMVRHEDVIRRCIENHDAHGVPQPDQPGGEGWRNKLYDERTRDDVLRHLAQNFMRGHVLSDLDGWADLTDDDASGYLTGVELEMVWERP